MEEVKKKRGRPRGTGLGKALVETTEVLSHVKNLRGIMDVMSERQRKLYVGLFQDQFPLVVLFSF